MQGVIQFLPGMFVNRCRILKAEYRNLMMLCGQVTALDSVAEAKHPIQKNLE
jgi:hypothetical protein